MKKFGLILLLALAGCQGYKTISGAINAYSYLQGVTITQSQMDVAVAAYDVAVLTPFNLYRYSDAGFVTPRRYCTVSKPFSIQDPCANFRILSKIQPYVAKAEAARVKLQVCVNTSCSAMSALVAAFQATWTDAQKVIEAEKLANGV